MRQTTRQAQRPRRLLCPSERRRVQVNEAMPTEEPDTEDRRSLELIGQMPYLQEIAVESHDNMSGTKQFHVFSRIRKTLAVRPAASSLSSSLALNNNLTCQRMDRGAASTPPESHLGAAEAGCTARRTPFWGPSCGARRLPYLELHGHHAQ